MQYLEVYIKCFSKIGAHNKKEKKAYNSNPDEKNENRKRREDRKRTYSKMLNESRNVVADELLFKVSNNFFQK